MEKNNKTFFCLKTREHGKVFVSFSTHAKERTEERGLNEMHLTASICTHFNELELSANKGEVALIDNTGKFSIILSVSKTDKGIYYVNVITVLNKVPEEDSVPVTFFDDTILCYA